MPHRSKLAFLASGGGAGALMRSLDWSATPLGPPLGWPSPLTTLVEVMLGSNQPMFVVWGPERTLLYNDPYAEVLGTKHPDALGRDFLEVWHEIRADLVPLVEQAYGGEPVHMDRITLIMHRRGFPEETHFSFSYTPVRDETGQVAGFFCPCNETTGQVLAEQRLRESEELNRRVLQSSADCIKVLSLDARLEFMSEGGLCVMEVDDFGAIQGAYWPDLWQGEEHARALSAIGEAKRGDTGRFQGFATTMKGTPRWWDVIVTPINGPEGKPEKLLSVSRDVTATRQAEAQLRELNETLEAQVAARTAERDQMWETSPDLMLVIDFDGCFRRVNPAWTALLGYAPEELVGHHVNEFVLPDDHAPTVDAYETAAAGGRPAIENRYRHKDGSVRWISWVAAPAGDVTYATGRDVTAEKEREAELAARTAERDRLWNLSQDMLARADYGGMMSAVSPAWTQVLGWSETELLSLPYATFMHPDDMPPTLAAIGRMAETRWPTRFENRIATQDGGFKPIEWTVAPEPDGVNFIAVGRDLSHTKAREAELAVAQEQLRQAQKMEAVGQLTGGVAHDFNNLLTIIKSSTDLLRRPGLAEERRRRYVDAISDTVDRAARLTGQLLAFARRQALKPEVFDAAERVRGVADMLRTIVGARVQIDTDLACAPCFVEADASQFETALVNMAVNARDAMDGEGRLAIRVDEVAALPPIRGHAGSPGRFVAVSLADTGHGIEADKVVQVFEPFFTTKELGKGTGLGLSQVFGFAKQSGGDVMVESEVGQGTTFTLYLPRVEGDRAAAGRKGARAAGAEVHGRGRRVLVVEDNVEVGRFSTQVLQDLGYETVWAANADEALRLLARVDDFDVVFSDMVMPGMSGVELAEEVRRRHPGLPVVLTSGYSHVLAQEGTHGFELIHKPYAAEELSRVLRRVTRKRHTARSVTVV